MSYVDGFVLPIPTKNLKAYKKMASEGARIWKKCGALSYVEAVGDDLASAKKMGVVMFPAMAKVKKGETVVFAYIVFKNRKHRDQVNAKVMKMMEKEAKKYEDEKMPFDMKRMAYGGFEMIVEA